MIINRRMFIETTVKGSAAILVVGSGLPAFASTASAQRAPLPRISQVKEPLAITMWDYSWILRHHRYGEFENYDKALEELAERGYNAIRLDVMPQFIASNKDTGAITEEYRAVKEGWNLALWGNDYTMSFRPREALVEFLTKCKKYKIRVGLSSWFLRHGTDITDIFMEEGGLYRAWEETLAFLESQHLLDDNILYVDLLNEYPNWHGYDWLKNELNKRSDAQKFRLDNPNANLPDPDVVGKDNTLLQKTFYNQFVNDLIIRLKAKYPTMDFFVSLDSGLENIDLTNFAAIDHHAWFHHHSNIPGIDVIYNHEQGAAIDYRSTLKNLKTYWTENKKEMTEWMNNRLGAISRAGKEHGLVCGNTEGWGAVNWFDHPELDWSWIKESAEVCIDLLQAYPNYKFICTSNFTHPQFKGIWEDVKWHKAMTRKIKQMR